MARPSELIAGNCYFTVGYLDSELLIPRVETLLFVGEDTAEDPRVWRFRYPQLDENHKDCGSELLITDEQLFQVIDFPELQRVLQEIATLHPLTHPCSLPLPVSADSVEFESLAAEVDKLRSDPASGAVTITIKFTDDGFSLHRLPNGEIEAHFFTHPRLDVTEEEKVLAFFLSMGIGPHVDYLASKAEPGYLISLCPKVQSRSSQFAVACLAKSTVCVLMTYLSIAPTTDQILSAR
jgi:hypothetical protein